MSNDIVLLWGIMIVYSTIMICIGVFLNWVVNQERRLGGNPRLGGVAALMLAAALGGGYLLANAIGSLYF